LDEIDVKIISKMQGDIPIEKEPYKSIAAKIGISEAQLLSKLEKMKQEGKLRRVGAILKHRNAGFKANAMVAWNVRDEKVDEIGELFAKYKETTHVYQRPSYLEWPYNIFTMIHSTSYEECSRIIESMSNASGIKDYKILYSVKEYKKTSMEYVKKS